MPPPSQPHSEGGHYTPALHHFILPLAAFLAVLPLILQGCSCGHDFNFHLLNWMEAARQFAHGNLHLHWAFTPAYNAGEPRFVFYPPLSWTIGAILSFLMPWTWTPIAYTWLILTAAGFALYRLAREFAAPNAALLAAAFYLVNPYTLFTAYERTAYAELLAAVWIPLLLLSILGKKITIPRIAIPIALLWLTDAPAAVMGCYALALLTFIRLCLPAKKLGAPCLDSETWVSPGVPSFAASPRRVGSHRSSTAPITRLQLAFTTTAGTLLGLGLAAFYILPAAYERRFVSIAMAILPEMSIQDNFLFHHSPDPVHDAVLRTASLIALLLLALTAITLRALTQNVPTPQPHQERENQPSRGLLLPLTILTIAIAFLLIPLSTPIWTHLPELVFLQFPWRFLAILAAVLSLAVALLLKPLERNRALPQNSVISTGAKRSGETPAFALKPTLTTAIALLLAVTLAFSSSHLFRQPCDDEDNISARLALFQSNTGTEPTDEYTPTIADNDALGQSNPPYWLIPNLNKEDQAAPANVTPGLAPTHLTLNSAKPQILVLNLRSYPNWRVTLNQTPIAHRIARNDGLIAFPIPAGHSQIDITYHRTLDQTLGARLSLLSLALLSLSLRRKPNP
jgi:hypothetical protein